MRSVEGHVQDSRSCHDEQPDDQQPAKHAGPVLQLRIAHRRVGHERLEPLLQRAHERDDRADGDDIRALPYLAVEPLTEHEELAAADVEDVPDGKDKSHGASPFGSDL